MAKRTAIIDIGSNSARLVIFEKTSRYGFHLICEQKSKVRIGEGAYENGGFLQKEPMRRAYFTLRAFTQTIEKYRAKKVICVATSALRDAPNRQIFIDWIKKELDIRIKVIEGDTEAFFGGVAASNLLPVTEAITIDVGGGSADMALIVKGAVTETVSLDLGTVRLKELFYDKSCPPHEAAKQASAYIKKELEKIPKTFKSDIAVGIGGSARALSKGIMKQNNYPFDKLHAFSYRYETHRDYFSDIAQSPVKRLKSFAIKKSRFDTIREGALILKHILDHIQAKEIITSSAGVREGVFLTQMLKKERYRYPEKLNPSIVSILDRFKPQLSLDKKKKNKLKLANKLLQTLPCPEGSFDYASELRHSLLLSGIGNTLTIYKSHEHAFYIAMQELNYRFTHRSIILIASLLKMHGKELVEEEILSRYKLLLPKRKIFRWLSFIHSLCIYLHEASNFAEIDFVFHNDTLTIRSDQSLYLAKEAIKGMEKPAPFAIVFEDATKAPKPPA